MSFFDNISEFGPKDEDLNLISSLFVHQNSQNCYFDSTATVFLIIHKFKPIMLHWYILSILKTTRYVNFELNGNSVKTDFQHYIICPTLTLPKIHFFLT